MKGLFIPEITAEMFRNGCLEGIEALMAEGEVYDIDYTGWIPVSDDTLPKDARPVLVYAWNVHHVVGQYKNMMNIDGEFEDMWVTASAYEAPHKIENVIAWKPLTIPDKE